MAKRRNNNSSACKEASEQGPVSKKNVSKDIRRFFSNTLLTTCTRLVMTSLLHAVQRLSATEPHKVAL